MRDGDAAGAESLIAAGVDISWEWRDAAPEGDVRGEKQQKFDNYYGHEPTQNWWLYVWKQQYEIQNDVKKVQYKSQGGVV